MYPSLPEGTMVMEVSEIPRSHCTSHPSIENNPSTHLIGFLAIQRRTPRRNSSMSDPKLRMGSYSDRPLLSPFDFTLTMQSLKAPPV
jgi:hypothetical protein